MEGRTLGNYVVGALLGEGGMGAVYRAHHALLGRAAAVKVLLPSLSQNEEMVHRFFNEARAATLIRHPGIVEIYDFGYADDGCAYLVMELLEGQSLAARIAACGRLPVGDAVAIARQVASALGAAHDSGIVHRDLKPDNIFLVPDPDLPGGERIRLLDFGIAKLTSDGPLHRTHAGVVMGTPAYMAPEQALGTGLVDLRADLYALGCILFEMLTGRPPFSGGNVTEVIAAHLAAPPPDLAVLAPHVPVALRNVVARLLSKDREHRYPDCAATSAALAEAIGLEVTSRASARLQVVTPPRSRRAATLAAVAAIVFVVGGSVLAIALTSAPTTAGGAGMDAGARQLDSVVTAQDAGHAAADAAVDRGADGGAATATGSIAGKRPEKTTKAKSRVKRRPPKGTATAVVGGAVEHAWPQDSPAARFAALLELITSHASRKEYASALSLCQEMVTVAPSSELREKGAYSCVLAACLGGKAGSAKLYARLVHAPPLLQSIQHTCGVAGIPLD